MHMGSKENFNHLLKTLYY